MVQKYAMVRALDSMFVSRTTFFHLFQNVFFLNLNSLHLNFRATFRSTEYAIPDYGEPERDERDRVRKHRFQEWEGEERTRLDAERGGGRCHRVDTTRSRCGWYVDAAEAEVR